MKNYYEDILVKFEQLFKEKKYKQLFEMVQEELAAPYVPLEYEERFLQYQSQLKSTLLINQVQKVKQLSLKKAAQLLSNSQLNDFDAFYLIEQIKDFNLNSLINEIKYFFLNYELQWFIRIKMIAILIDQKIDHLFKINYINKYLCIKSEVFINPLKFDYYNFEKIQIKCFLLLQNYVEINNPSLFEICRVISLDLIAQLYLHEPNLNNYIDAIVYFVINDALKCLNSDEQASDYFQQPQKEKINFIFNLINNNKRKK